MSPEELLDKVNTVIDNPNIIMTHVAKAMMLELRNRVHVEGKDSSGNQIGTYSPEYMKLRTGNYRNSGRKSRGINKGELKDSGKFTAGVNKGLARPNYHKDADPKVILSLTRQMENDLSVVETPTGYGIGYINHHNYQKALWCEETYKKPILTQLTSDEITKANNVANEMIARFLNGENITNT